MRLGSRRDNSTHARTSRGRSHAPELCRAHPRRADHRGARRQAAALAARLRPAAAGGADGRRGHAARQVPVARRSTAAGCCCIWACRARSRSATPGDAAARTTISTSSPTRGTLRLTDPRRFGAVVWSPPLDAGMAAQAAGRPRPRAVRLRPSPARYLHAGAAAAAASRSSRRCSAARSSSAPATSTPARRCSRPASTRARAATASAGRAASALAGGGARARWRARSSSAARPCATSAMPTAWPATSSCRRGLRPRRRALPALRRARSGASCRASARPFSARLPAPLSAVGIALSASRWRADASAGRGGLRYDACGSLPLGPPAAMTPSFAISLDALGGWRTTLGRAARRAGRASSPSTSWSTPPAAAQLAALRERLGNEKLVRRLRRRVLARQVRADQRDLLRRHRPPHPAGDARPHDDVPGRAGAGTPRSRPRLALLPIETRLRRPVARRAARPARAPGSACRSTSATPSSSPQALPEVTRTECVSVDAGARARLLGRRAPRRQPAARRRRPGRGAGLAPRADQLPAPAAEARPGRARHAGPERDRRRARADAGPAADGARDRLHPRRRHRRHASPTWRSGATTSAAHALDALRRAEQDRHAGRPAADAAQVRGADRRAARRAPRARCGVPPSACSRCRRARRWRRASTATTRRCARAACRSSRRRSARSCCRSAAQVLEQVVLDGVAAAARRRSRARLGDRRRQLAEQMLELRGLRGKSGAKVRLMLQRVDAETAEFEQCTRAPAGAARGAQRAC